MEVYVIKGMWKIIKKDANQPQDSVYLWDQEGNCGFNYICNILFFNIYIGVRTFLIAQLVKNMPEMQETPVRFLG